MERKINISEKFGDWFLDIAKYIATATILASLFSNVNGSWLVSIAGMMLLGALVIAIVLFSIANNSNKASTTKKNK